jgi:urease accessory protein
MDSNAHLRDSSSDLEYLRLLHLADSALPIGALAHSFGLESLVAQGLSTKDLPDFLRGFLEEAGIMEAVFCRESFRLANAEPQSFPIERWLEINDKLSALKPARESRAGSASLGQNLLMAMTALGEFPVLQEALQAAKRAGSACNHSPAFGFAAGVLGFNEDQAVLAYLHQSVASLVSACQRLLPLGQSEATKILWQIKPAVIETATRSADCSVEDVSCFMPLIDWGGMEHPALAMRLFVS